MTESSDFDKELKVFTSEPPVLTREYIDSLRNLEPPRPFHIKNIVEHKDEGVVRREYQEFDYEPLGYGARIETWAQGAAPDTPMKDQADIRRYAVLFFRDKDSEPIEIVSFGVDMDRAPHLVWRGIAIDAHQSAIILVKQRINLERLPEFSQKFLKEKIAGIGEELAPAIQKEIKDKLGS